MRDAQKHTASLLGFNASFNCLMPRAAPHATRKRLLMNSTSPPQAREARSANARSKRQLLLLAIRRKRTNCAHYPIVCDSQNHSACLHDVDIPSQTKKFPYYMRRRANRKLERWTTDSLCAAVIFDFTCAAVQALKRPSVSRLSLQQLPHHMHQVSLQRDLDALTLQLRSLPLLRPRPTASTREQLLATVFTVHLLCGIITSVSEFPGRESPLHDGGGLPSAPHLVHAIAHVWPRGQHRWKRPRNRRTQ